MNNQEDSDAPSRAEIEEDILRQIRREAQGTISAHAPARWTQDKREAVEKAALEASQHILDALTMAELLSDRALEAHLVRVADETKRLIRSGGPVVITYQ